MRSRAEVEEGIRFLIQAVKPLGYVLNRLEAAGLRYGLYAGAHVSLVTGNRAATDIDFLVHDDDLAELRRAFPYAKSKDLGDGVFLYVGADDAIEFMGAASIMRDGSSYPFRLTQLAVQHVESYSVGPHKLKVVNLVDTLLLKALLLRGPEQGKHDLEDIQAAIAGTSLDRAYLRARLDETGSRKITMSTWQRFGIVV
jgi:hypothetical protein